MGVCSNYHFVIARPLQPLAFGAEGVQGVGFFVHPGTGGSHAWNATKLLKVVTFDNFHTRSHYSFEDSSLFTSLRSSNHLGVLASPRANWPPVRPKTWLGALKGKLWFWGSMGVQSNNHFAIAQPLRPQPPWGWGRQGVSFEVHPWTRAAMRLRPPSS